MSADPERAQRIEADSVTYPLCLQWLDNPGNFPRIPSPPPAISSIGDLRLRQRAIDAWLCACRLRKIIDVWHEWFSLLTTAGDADPGAAFRLSETASACARALWEGGAAIPTLRRDGPEWVEARLPDVPHGANGEWQKDTQMIETGCERLRSLRQFQGELMTFMTRLANSPSTGFVAPPPMLDPPREPPAAPPTDARSPRPNETTEQPIMDALFEMKAVGLDGLKSIPRHKRPMGERLAPKAIGRACDGLFKATLAHMVDLGWLDNGRNHGVGGGYFLTEAGAALATQRQRPKTRS